MPKRMTPHKAGTQRIGRCSRRCSITVTTPTCSSRTNYFRIQVKTVDASSEDLELESRWSGSNVHYVAVFARNSSWGIVFPAFSEPKRKLKDAGCAKFQLKGASFMKAFHSLPFPSTSP